MKSIKHKDSLCISSQRCVLISHEESIARWKAYVLKRSGKKSDTSSSVKKRKMTTHKDIVDEGKECNNVVTKRSIRTQKGKRDDIFDWGHYDEDYEYDE